MYTKELQKEIKQIIKDQKLNCSIEEFKDLVNWYNISANQQLSEKFILENKDLVDWNYISRFQKLSEKFIKENKDLINIKEQKLSFKEKTLKQKIKEAKIYAKKHNLKINKIYLYAFRNHDFHKRGIFNKTISYKKGIYYKDWRCDMNKDNKNSFGFGIWPEGNTKIKIKISDWGVEVNREDGKARVSGFEII